MQDPLASLFEDEPEEITTVVNIRTETCEVRIDRGTIWGNPFSHLPKSAAKWQVSTREEAITKYREYILEQPELLEKLDTLKGKKLGCWCKPKSCHGDVLIELLHSRRSSK